MKKAIQHVKIDMLLAVLLVLFVLISGCRQRMVDAEAEERGPLSGKLLVLPFHNMSELYGENENVRCPVCGKVFITGEVPDKATDFLNDTLISMLKEGQYYKKMAVSDSQWVHTDLMLKNNRSLSEFELLLSAGRSVKADAVMVGYLYRYKQRVWSRISVDSAASVALGMHLIDVKTGRQLWKGHFDETQRSLSENLFKIDKFIKRKASWVTADEMAVSGLKEMLETLPKK
ncbi:MAG: DUF799 domain-containing protein [Desulfobacterales bacterium]|nr:DUF799 domain-containing protein [Desulfobacterales bacterium]